MEARRRVTREHPRTRPERAAHAPHELRAPGSPLDARIRQVMEPRFGHDFSKVRVHTGPEADESADALDSRAFALGHDLVFTDDGFRPDTALGTLILAHELAHVVQYDHWPETDRDDLASAPAPADFAELDAHRAALGVLAGGPVSVSAPPGPGAATFLDDLLEGASTLVSQAGNAFSQEGLGAVLDPFGALDRQQAQAELADRFSVVGDDFVGPRLPNQVSQQEYQDLCRNYSDIRMGRGDLTIDTAGMGDEQAEAYRSGVMTDIASMLQTQSGRGEIAGLSNNVLVDDAGNTRNGIWGMELPWGLGDPIHRHTTLTALYQDANNNKDRTDDVGAPIDTTNGYADPEDHADMSRRADGSRGAGTDVTIRYNPGVNVLENAGLSDPWLPFRSDVLLAHEMRHAMHETQGTMDSSMVDATTGDGVADDAGRHRRWEHQAVGIGLYANDPMSENAYRAERALLGAAGAPGVRTGDVGMPQRSTYSVHRPPAPAPAPAPGAPAAPGAILDPHDVVGGGHRHDHEHAHAY
jgi:hypothetical protein